MSLLYKFMNQSRFLQISTLISFSARFVTRWPRKEQPSVESGPISNLLFSCCLHEGFSIREVKNSTLQILFLKWKPRPFKVDFRLIRESNSCKNMQANSQNRNSHRRKKKSLHLKRLPSDGGGIKFCKLERFLFEDGIWSEAVVNSVWGGAVSDWIYTHLTSALLFVSLIKDVIHYHFANIVSFVSVFAILV